MENDKEKLADSSDQKQKNEKGSKTKDPEEVSDDKGTRCGFGSFKPDWLQFLARKESYILIYCICGLTIGMFFTYTVSVLSTIEKRFKFSSKITGVILAGNDISQVMLCILIAYFGNYGHRPRWMAFGGISGALSSLLAGAPHILYGPGEEAERYNVLAQHGAANTSSILSSEDESTDGLCHQPFNATCDAEAKGLDSEAELGAVVLLFVSHFFVGITISIFYSIGFTYLDDNIDKKEMPFYYALSLILRIVGPILGYFMGSRCLKLWVTPNIEPNLSTKDPRWLGAWWLGYIGLGFFMFLFSFPFFLFPRKLPEAAKRDAEKAARKAKRENALKTNQESSKVDKEVQDTRNEAKRIESETADTEKKAKEVESLGKKKGETPKSKASKLVMSLINSPPSKTSGTHEKPSLRNLPKALMRLFTNKLWMGNLFGTLIYAFGMAGYWYFKPKYLENQFRKSASDANFYTGVASMIASIVGLAVSGAILRWIRPGPRIVAGYAIFLTLFSAVAMITLMFIGCPKLDVKGPMPGAAPLACSSDCDCTDRFVPVCAQDGVTVFYSPCYAGCTASNTTASPIEYSNCKCIPNTPKQSTSALSDKVAYELEHLNISAQDPIDVFSSSADDLAQESLWGSATRGFCEEDCNAFTLYIIIQIITNTVSATGRVGYTLVHLRSVAEEDKALALGTFTVMLSLLTYIPCPIVMGAIIDSACLIWEDKCGEQGNCWFYDSDKFRVIIHAVPAGLILVSVLGDLAVYRYCSRLKLYGDEEEEEGENGESKKVVAEIDSQMSSV